MEAITGLALALLPWIIVLVYAHCADKRKRT